MAASSPVIPSVVEESQHVPVERPLYRVGILSRSEGFFGFSDEDSVLIPLSTAQTRLNNQRVISGEQAIDFIIVQGRNPEAAAVPVVTPEDTMLLREIRNALVKT